MDILLLRLLSLLYTPLYVLREQLFTTRFDISNSYIVLRVPVSSPESRLLTGVTLFV